MTIRIIHEGIKGRLFESMKDKKVKKIECSEVQMGVKAIIDKAKTRMRSALTEAESKQILARYGIPIVKESAVLTPEEAVQVADALGYPVVLKGLGSKLMHKTEQGVVRLNLSDRAEVMIAANVIRGAVGDDLEGYLVQKMMQGHREFVAGVFRDAQFGPVVMFGLGGIFTEVIADVSFRIAPLDENHARQMINELKSHKILGAFRGESAADHDKLLKVLMGLSRLSIEHPEIKEVDINPLIIGSDGNVTAVDALIVIGDNAIACAQEIMSEDEVELRAAEIRIAIDAMAHARSVAIIGATEARQGQYPGMFSCMRNFGYPGRIYPVNPNLDAIDGLKTYPDLVSLPERVDLVIVSVPRTLVLGALKDCIASGNRNVHIFTSGFKETGEKEGVELQQEIEKIAFEGGLKVVGPNCMGFYVPAARMLTWLKASTKSGPVSLISQSGGNAQDFTHYTTSKYDIHFSKVFSYGNALTLDSTDFLDYLEYDEETKIITMYLEGVKDGRLLLKLARKINSRKPIIMLKGGLTESGARAAASHTGSMAGGLKVWNAFSRQSGVVLVESVEQMADVTLAFHHLGKTAGRRVAVLGFGGGMGVAMADACARAGLELPALSADAVKKLRNIISPAGTMIKNPVDAYEAFQNLDLVGKILNVLSASGEIDNIVIWLPLDWLYIVKGSYLEEIARYLVHEGRKHARDKSLIVVWKQYEPNPEISKWISIVEKILLSGGIPVYKDFSNAASALSKLAEYGEWLNLNRN